MTSLLDEVLERADILDVVSRHVKLRKTGRNYVGLCPFHKEKTPSFTVSTEKQIYYCFGCHEGGNAVHFLSRFEHTNFQETLEGLADHYGITIHRGAGSKRASTFDALSKLCDFYYQNLQKSKFASTYLTSRGIDKATVDEFRIGYSEGVFKGRDFLKNAGIPIDMLLDLAILKTREADVYDIFRGRIVIPIMDVNGKVIGFGGRATRQDVMPKYINSPESSVFQKRSVLYGIDKTKKQITESDEAFVVEGYFDFIALYQAGIRNVVATLGTSITEEQLSRLRNYTENITLMLDGDEAGVKSALRVVGIFGEMGINGSMVILPDGHDPDSLLREKGPSALATIEAAKKPLMDCFFDFYMSRTKLSTLDGKIRFIGTIMPVINEIRDGVRRRLYVQRLAELTGIEEYRFLDQIRGQGGEGTNGSGHEVKGGIEKRIIGILVHRPELIELFKGKEVKGYIQDTDLREALEKAIDMYQKSGRIDLNRLVSTFDKPAIREIVAGCAVEAADYSSDDMEKMIRDYFFYVEQKRMKEESKRITEQLNRAEKEGDEAAVRDLLERKREALMFLKTKSAK